MTLEARHARVLRGVVAAVLATFVAMTSHVLAGAEFPSLLGLGITLILSMFVCVLLAARALSLWRLSVSVVASQAMFHWMFSASSGHSGMPASPAADSHAVPGMGHAGMHHIDPGALPSPSVEAAAHSHSSPAMLVSHLIAAVVTITVFHWSEQMLQRLAALGRLLWTVLVPVVAVVCAPVPRYRLPAGGFEPAGLLPLGASRSPVLQRGPPLGAL